ncbi:unnamed protein product, partial [marine sediment metagenome]
LQYKDGIFLKALLESITEFDATGKEFYTHRFDYYNDIQVNNEQIPFAPEKKWNLPDDDLKSPYLNLFLDNISALGGSGSVGGSGTIAATVGLFDGKMFLKSMTAGGNVSYLGSKNEGFLTLVDLNGDELPDKVYKKDDGVYYRPNLLSYPSEEMFGEKRLVEGIDNFSISKSSGFGWGVEASPPSSFIGYDNVNSKTKTNVYFDDFNADGLVDLVDNGVVYFNHLNENGDPVFTTTSGTYLSNARIGVTFIGCEKLSILSRPKDNINALSAIIDNSCLTGLLNIVENSGMALKDKSGLPSFPVRGVPSSILVYSI